MKLVKTLPLVAALTATACGGGSSPSSPGTVPTPPAGAPVSGVVYYDENANGSLDPTETVRLPGVTVAVAGVSAQSSNGGRFTASNVPMGTQTAQARADTLPAYFTPGVPVSVNVPAPGDVAVPAVLTIGSSKRPNVYLAFGDSITWGDGSSNGGGYRDFLAEQLRAYWGSAQILNDGQPGSKSLVGQSRLPGDVAVNRPAYALILYGTNDWNDAECREAFPCYTVDALRAIVQDTRSAGVHPVLGTIPPVNPAYVDRRADERNDWVTRMNVLVRQMAAQEKVALAEVHGDFLKQPSLPPLYNDFLHPNDTGYEVLAKSFFAAITKPLAASSAGGPSFFFTNGRP